jgi:hypothetical protein
LRRYEDAIAAYLKQGPQPYCIHGLLAAAYAQLGQSENARGAIATMLKFKPDCVLGTFERLAIHVDRRVREHFLDGLRKAGLPE